jgi:hypothetical protein
VEQRYAIPGAAAEPLALKSSAHRKAPGSLIPGFVKAKHDVLLPVFEAPHVPKDFVGFHKFPEAPKEGRLNWALQGACCCLHRNKLVLLGMVG